MLELKKDDIHLEQHAENKQEAIKKIAHALTTQQLVEEGYVAGMLEREAQAATYLGSGIAIPHGTTTTRHLVKKTGVQVFHFPDGVIWGDDGEKAYIAIGIAASSNEHLTILRQLTHVLGDDDVEEQIRQIKTVDQALALLTGQSNTTSHFEIDRSSLLLDISADSLSMLQALNASRLKSCAAVNADFLVNVLDNQPNYLGQGVWLSDSTQGNLKNGVAITRTNSDITEAGNPVKVLITVAAIDDGVDNFVNILSKLMFNGELTQLIISGQSQLLALINGEEIIKVNDHASTTTQSTENVEISSTNKTDEQTNENVLSREFVVINPHGVHTRPASVLVKLVKEFSSKITVANLDGTANPVSATSLMKIVGIGAKKGSRLQFVAEGDDAEQALDAIGHAIANGLGEGGE